MINTNRFHDASGLPVEVKPLNPLPVTDVLAPRTSFGDLAVSEVTPIIQYMAVYGFSDKVETFINGDAAVSIKDRQFNATTGTAAQSGAAVLSSRRLTYNPGQGIQCRFTAIFENQQINSRMIGGFISSTESLGFGYNTAGEFGIHFETDGGVEIQELTITSPATGSEVAVVTVNGAAYNVNLTVGSAAHNAYEIAIALNGTVPLYQFASNGDVVTARADVALPAGAFAFASATATGNWLQVAVGAFTDPSKFIKQTDWNGGANLPDFDPSKGNVYQISMQFLGFGNIRFFIENPATGAFDLVHVIQYANNNILPSVVNPTFRVGIFTANTIGTAGVGEIRLSSAFGAVEGKNFQTAPSRATDVEGMVESGLKSILTIRNRIVFGGLDNRVEVVPLILSVGTSANKSVIIEVSVNAVHDGDKIFSYIDQQNSVIEVATDSNNVTGGRFVHAFVVPSDSANTFDLSDLRALIFPGEEITISARVSQGGASADILMALVWQEDL